MKTQLSLLTLFCWTITSINAMPIATKTEISTKDIPTAVTGSITAVGIGVSSLDVANKFYSTALGFGKGNRMSFSGWDEDIMTSRSGGPAIIPMKFKASAAMPERSVKNLPVKLQFSCADAKAVQTKIVAAGGSVVETPTAAAAGQKEGTLYAKDPDGYLLELVPGGTGTGLSAVGYGSSDPTKSATFFSHLAGTQPGQSEKKEAWDIITVPTKKKMNVQFLDFHDQRSTKKLPLKIVWGVPNINGFKKTITDNGGSLVTQSIGALGAFVGLGYDSVDQIMIEINSGG